jgi:DNA-binding transcriptional LysR family regulator
LFEEGFTKAGLAYQEGLEAGGWEAIKTYAAAGFGVAVVPELCLSKEDRRRLAVRNTGTSSARTATGLSLGVERPCLQPPGSSSVWWIRNILF